MSEVTSSSEATKIVPTNHGSRKRTAARDEQQRFKHQPVVEQKEKAEMIVVEQKEKAEMKVIEKTEQLEKHSIGQYVDSC